MRKKKQTENIVEEKTKNTFSTDDLSKGETIYYVFVNPLTKEARLLEGTIMNILPTVIICSQHRAEMLCVDIKDIDMVFKDRYHAEQRLKEVCE